MTAFVLGHHSDLPTIPMPTNAVSAAPANAYVLTRGFTVGALMGARVFVDAAAAGPAARAASAVRPAVAAGVRSGLGTARAISATGAGAVNPSPAGAGPTRLGSRRLDSTGKGGRRSGAAAGRPVAMSEVG